MPSALNKQQSLTPSWKPSAGLTFDQLRGQMSSLGVYGSYGHNNQLEGRIPQGDPRYDAQKAADYDAMAQYAADQGWIQPHQASWSSLKGAAKSVAPVALAALGGYALSSLGAGAGAGGWTGGGAGVGGGSGGVTGLGAGTGVFGGMGTGTMATVGGGLASTGAGIGAGTAAGAGGLLGLGLTGKDLIGLGVGGLGTIYAANRANKVASEQSDIARQALDIANRPRYTQYGSSVDPRTGNTFFDPSIRAMREQSLQNIPQYQSILSGQLNSSLSGIGQNRGRLEDLYGQTNDNAFLDPILQNLALQRGQLSRGLTNRGLGGSSFMANALGNFESAAAPGVAQARQQGLLARQDILEQMGNMDTQGISTASQGVAQLQNLDNLYANVSGQNLQQELAALGLSQADIGAILGAGQQIGAAGKLKNETTGRALDVFGRLLGGSNA
jgi:hypothetical protein